MKTFASISLISIAAALTPAPAEAAPGAEAVLGAEAAKALPIADMHFHVMPFMTDGELRERMDGHGVRWAGGVGITGRDGVARKPEIASAFGQRFIGYTGHHQWLGLKRSGGAAALEDAGSPAFQQALEQMEKELREGARVIGEIHVNTANSAPSELLRHKIRADAPTLRAMFALAAKYRRPLNVHAQWDSDTAEQLGALADSNPAGVLILAHCGSTASASEIRGFFERHANAVCDLSFRSPAQLPARSADRAAYTANSLRADWKALIESFPERFMAGIDDVHDWGQYDSVAASIRFGLLANLSPATAEKVAHGNAERLFGLEPVE